MTKTTNKIKTKIPVKYQKKITELYENRVRKVPIKTDRLYITKGSKYELGVNHTNFAEEIYQSQKTDKFFNRILTVGYIICAICAIILATTYIIK